MRPPGSSALPPANAQFTNEQKAVQSAAFSFRRGGNAATAEAAAQAVWPGMTAGDVPAILADARNAMRAAADLARGYNNTIDPLLNQQQHTAGTEVQYTASVLLRDSRGNERFVEVQVSLPYGATADEFREAALARGQQYADLADKYGGGTAVRVGAGTLIA